MLTTVWGPSLWHYLHIMSFNYPVEPCEKDKKHYKEFMLNLKNVLPCKYCRINLKKNYKALPLTENDLKTRENFAKYVYNLHELVNKMLNKTSNLSFEQVRERYEHFRARCVNPLSELKIRSIKETKKKTISSTIKKLVWNTNIGEDIGKSKCLCCKSTDITQISFNCGHIIAEANGGETIVSNLKPVCQNCNSSMGTKNMNDFMNTLK